MQAECSFHEHPVYILWNVFKRKYIYLLRRIQQIK